VRFVDSHLHLEGAVAASQLALASATGTLLFACGIDRETSFVALRQADLAPETVKAFVGVHPSEVLKETSLTWFEPALRSASGAGEIGLDPKYSTKGAGSPQMKAFLAQLEAAQAADRPVQVHSRNAERECLDALGGFSLGGVLMHWYQSELLLQEVVERGYFVSFGPSVIYSKKLQRMALRCPHDQTLAETDSPVPFGALGGVRGPSLVPSVVFKLSELWREGFEDTRNTLAGNADRFLRASEKG
jgi:TatD DNase family protein